MTSRIKVDEIYSRTAGIGVSFINGLTVAPGFGVTFSENLTIDGTLTLNSGILNGDGSGLTNLVGRATPSLTFSYSTIL
jgi:hypothetical protein